MPNKNHFEQLDLQKDVLEAIEKIKKLEKQRKDPDRNGMIAALQEAKDKAPIEITALEFSQGDTHWMLFDNFSNPDLYRKLYQYQQGLENYCIERVGKEAFDKLMNGDSEA